MAFNPVIYSEKLKQKVKLFKSLPRDERVGNYWDNNDDKDLAVLKAHIKNHYLIAQNFTCPYCQQRIVVEHNSAWDTEHIIPKSTHPDFIFEPINLCVSCKDCNNEKRNKNVLKNSKRTTLPKKREDYIFAHPHLDNYSEHIKVVDSSLYFLPKTEKGRRTIEICGLLRFIYSYTSYGNVKLEIKEGISRYTQALLNTTDPAEEVMYLSFIEELTNRGKELSKLEFQKKFGL
ncbi:HNH endonuclease [Serratia fonticola]|uniref:HNH endonuclease n=1 Tax=Serratia fonticola TaxID=47917 RepID=UPI00192A98C1|nr:HNH endonuclease domain-containing protein [Serratia fonticola]MBL5860061.1 HNH endonuclease [Serratia fonticola]